MAIKNKSEVSTIQGPEFINLEPVDINPLMSKCEIKVFYLGHNRNHSYINRETALEMAKTLRGTPIVASWKENKEDFGDHGHVVTIDDEGFHFSCTTVPYGFVSPDAEVWFQNFTDTDEFDNQVERTYLMTTGYLWTTQYEEITKVINEGQPHSMELDGNSLEGHWATDNNLGVEFFIINDATFSKLCILGDDVEPCYEGSSVTSPQISKNFSKDNKEFSQTLFTMMQELKHALSNEGGLNMENENDIQETEVVENEDFVEEDVVETETQEFEEETIEDSEDNENVETEEDDDKDDSDSEEFTEEQVEETEPEPTFTLEEYEALNSEVESLRAEVAELREFKVNIENQRKQALIDSYYMLSDEDKATIVENMANYTLDEIKAQLAVLYVEKNVDFNKVEDSSEDEHSPALSFNLDSDDSEEQLTALQAALREVAKY